MIDLYDERGHLLEGEEPRRIWREIADAHTAFFEKYPEVNTMHLELLLIQEVGTAAAFYKLRKRTKK